MSNIGFKVLKIGLKDAVEKQQLIIGECVCSFARYNKFLGIVKFSIL
jgi:hypothetical protein